LKNAGFQEPHAAETSDWTAGEARVGAREMLHNHRVLRAAIVDDRIPRELVEWVGL
jgi:hypothetical protein